MVWPSLIFLSRWSLLCWSACFVRWLSNISSIICILEHPPIHIWSKLDSVFQKKKIIARISRDLLRIVKALLSMFFSVYFLALILSGTYGNQHPWWISQETEVCAEAWCRESFFRWFHTRRLLMQEGMEWGWSVSLQQCSLLQDWAFNRGQKPAQVVSRGCCLASSVCISSLSKGRR